MKAKLFSLIYWFLIKKSSWQRKRVLKSFWKFLWEYSVYKYQGTINFRLHKEWIKMNNGYPYPLFVNTFFKYNHPLIEIVSQVCKAKSRPIDYIDVGAAIGDTMLLLFHKCPGMINQYYCFDGDREYYDYLLFNLRNHPNGKSYHALLSDGKNTEEKELVRTHLGTASVLGNNIVKTTTLDNVLIDVENVQNIDLIKIDVDGFDGKVMEGARQIIDKFKPVFIFEWHPIIWEKVGTSVFQPFDYLKNHGYEYFFFFDKLGNFSQIHHNISQSEIELLNELCLRDTYAKDWHFDVVALQPNSALDLNELMELTFSNTV